MLVGSLVVEDTLWFHHIHPFRLESRQENPPEECPDVRACQKAALHDPSQLPEGCEFWEQAMSTCIVSTINTSWMSMVLSN